MQHSQLVAVMVSEENEEPVCVNDAPDAKYCVVSNFALAQVTIYTVLEKNSITPFDCRFLIRLTDLQTSTATFPWEVSLVSTKGTPRELAKPAQ